MIREEDGTKVIRWAEQKFSAPFLQPCIPLGWSVDGRMVAAFIFNCIHENDVELSVVSDVGLTREMMLTVALMITEVIGSSRCSLTCRRDDEKTITMVRKMGFKVEGAKRRYYRDGTDAVLLGILREEFENVLRRKYLKRR